MADKPCHLHVPIILKSGTLNLLEPSGSVKACNGIAFTLDLPHVSASRCRHQRVVFTSEATQAVCVVDYDPSSVANCRTMYIPLQLAIIRIHAASGRPMLIHKCHAHAALCRGLEKSLSERHGRGMARAWHGMYESNTVPLCKSNGKDKI
jgi:hypothetical protein